MAKSARPAWIACLILALMIVVQVPADAQDSDDGFIDHAARQIACAYPPDPTAMLLYLNKSKRIDLKKGQRIDSETCWTLRPSLAIEDVSFTHICASAEDPLLVELFPRLYYRGPGTSAGTGLRLITNAESAALDDWVKRINERALVKGETKLVIGAPSFGEGKTEASCNSTSFLGD
jgi:hypothetical protein